MTKEVTHRVVIIALFLAAFWFPLYVLVSGNDPIDRPNSVLGALTRGVVTPDQAPEVFPATQAQADAWSNAVGQSFIGANLE